MVTLYHCYDILRNSSRTRQIFYNRIRSKVSAYKSNFLIEDKLKIIVKRETMDKECYPLLSSFFSKLSGLVNFFAAQLLLKKSREQQKKMIGSELEKIRVRGINVGRGKKVGLVNLLESVDYEFCRDIVVRSIAVQPVLSVSQWADRYRFLTSETSSEYGIWRTSRAPYQYEPLNVFNDGGVRRIVLLSSTQTMKTEMLLNYIGFTIHQSPRPILVLYPDEAMARSFSQERFDTMVKACPELLRCVSVYMQATSDNTIIYKKFGGGFIAFSGMSSKKLSMRPVGMVVIDEVDRAPLNISGEGDPIMLAEKRMATFSNRKIVLASSPTVKGKSRIEYEYNLSDMRVYLVPCLRCGFEFEFNFDQMRYVEKDGRAEDVYYECVSCRGKLFHHEKIEMLKRGRWKKQNSKVKDIVGFRINEMYSAFVSWDDICNNFIKIEKEQNIENQKRMRQVFINTSLAQTYEEDFENKLSAEALYEGFRKNLSGGVVPDVCFKLLAGIDVQKDYFAVEVRGVGAEGYSYSVDYYQCWGETSKEETFVSLIGGLQKGYKREDGVVLYVEAVAMDVGFNTEFIKTYSYKYRGELTFFLVKGAKTTTAIGDIKQSQPLDVNIDNMLLRKVLRFFILNVDSLKKELYGQLEIGNKKYIQFSRDHSLEYFRELASEVLVKEYKEKTGIYDEYFKKLRSRNEALDCAVYVNGLIRILGYSFLEKSELTNSLNKNTLQKRKRISGVAKLAW